MQLQDQKVKLVASDMQLDLGGIAKGFALDAALKIMREDFSIKRALIDGGGDVLAGDPPPGRNAWNVAIRNPKTNANTWVVPLTNAALATSGDVHQFVEIDGVRYSHIVDPKTGMGLTDRMQVSVISPTGMQADALASAISVLGEEEGLALIKDKPKSAVMLVLPGPKDGSVVIRRSEGFEVEEIE